MSTSPHTAGRGMNAEEVSLMDDFRNEVKLMMVRTASCAPHLAIIMRMCA